MLSITLTVFFKFHVKLAFQNSTTIEAMDKKMTNKSNYNKGYARNLHQIFGKNPWLWFLPFTGASGKPIGDGVVWASPISIDIEDIPDEESERKNSLAYHEKANKKDNEEHKSKEPITAPDSSSSRTEKFKMFYHPEAKQTSGRITEKITDDLILSPDT